MSYETDAEFVEQTEQEEKEYAERALFEKTQALKKQLETGKCFKDLILGREALWEAVKKEMMEYTYRHLVLGNDTITKDFLCGIKFFPDVVDARIIEFDQAFVEIGKE